MQSEFEHSSIVIEETKTELENLEQESGIFNGEGSKYDSLAESFNISAKLESLQKDIEDASRKIINLITIFIVQSIIMPLLFLWLFIASIKYIFKMKLPNEKWSVLVH